MAWVSGGYYIALPTKRARYMSPEFTPDAVISASACLCDFFPDAWTLEWASVSDAERTRAASLFGLTPAALADAVTWATASFGKAFGWPGAFYTLDAAREACARFLPSLVTTVIFGLGLNEEDVPDFLAAASPANKGLGGSGIFECVKAAEKIAEGGTFLGHELLATDYGLITCSWLCNGLEKECANRLDIRTNRSGFIETYEAARSCAEFISQPETGAEPGLWLPWAVTSYEGSAHKNAPYR